MLHSELSENVHSTNAKITKIVVLLQFLPIFIGDNIARSCNFMLS